MARVQVSDEVWGAYRAGLGTTPVSVALGELVRRQVGRSARGSARARELAGELSSLIARLERAAEANGVSARVKSSMLHGEGAHWSQVR
jgi:molybdenum-dependent DNA-binding transcriptional regulator ModE